MISITVRKRNGDYISFESRGHAEYAEEGQDIVCAAVSALTINTVNSIDEFTEDMIHVDSDDGLLRWDFYTATSKETKLLMDSLILGLTQIETNYGKQYLNTRIEEV